VSTSDPIAADLTADIATRRNRIHEGFSRFYATLAVVAFALTFLPYYRPETESSVRYGGLWQEVARTGDNYDVAAVMVFLALIVLLVFAALRKLPIPGLAVAAVLSVIIGSMVWSAPGYSDPPELTDVGVLDIAFCFTAAAMLLAHVTCLLV
jgi:hypothetical protein